MISNSITSLEKITLNSFLVLFLVLFYGCSQPSKTSIQNEIEPNSQTETKDEKAKIIFFGNSITAGYKLNPTDAFPNLIQQKIDSIGLNYKCINAGNSGETTSGGITRLNWVIKNGCKIFVLELGANDGLRGLKISETEKNLNQIIDMVLGKIPDVKILICGMKVPPSMGKTYAKEYDEMFARVGARSEVEFIPFLLDGVAGIPELNLEDGIHPTEKGHKILAKTVWEKLYPLL